jgi:hypothetical protein
MKDLLPLFHVVGRYLEILTDWRMPKTDMNRSDTFNLSVERLRRTGISRPVVIHLHVSTRGHQSPHHKRFQTRSCRTGAIKQAANRRLQALERH